MPNLLGTAPNQVPTNADLGTMAFQDSAAINVDSATVTTLNNNPVLSSGTANGVLYLNGSKAVTSGSALTFDGTNLGIGTSSPSAKLDISGGNIKITNNIPKIQAYDSDTANNYCEIDMGNGDFKVNIDPLNVFGSSNARFSIDGTEQMRLTSTGLGIGTSSPGAKLDVNGLVSVKYAGTQIGTFGNTAGYELKLIGTQSQPLIFGTASAERMRIDSSGNVGIGTSSPVYALDVSGTTSFTAGLWNPTAVAADVGANMVFAGGAAKNGLAEIKSGFSGAATTDGGYLAFKTRAITSGALTERMRIDSSGNVGIGTSSPTGKLNVNFGTAAYPVVFQGDSTRAIAVAQSDNTSGTDVAAGWRMSTYDGSAISAGGQLVAYSSISSTNPNHVKLINLRNAPIIFATNNTDRMTLNSSGNLGLGVTPSAWAAAYKAIDILGASVIGTTDSTIGSFQTNSYYNGTNWIYKSTGTAQRYLQAASIPHAWFTAPSGTAGNAITFTQAMTLDASNNLTVNAGNLVIGTSGKGIDFSATSQAGGMTSELLSDYEEGTWTPVFTSNGTTGNVTTSALNATYTKVGQVVHVQMRATLTVTTAPTGAYLIITLPFARKINTTFVGATSTYNIDLPTGAVGICTSPINEGVSDDKAILVCPTDNGASGVVDPSTLVTGDIIRFSFSYIAA